MGGSQLRAAACSKVPRRRFAHAENAGNCKIGRQRAVIVSTLKHVYFQMLTRPPQIGRVAIYRAVCCTTCFGFRLNNRKTVVKTNRPKTL